VATWIKAPSPSPPPRQARQALEQVRRAQHAIASITSPPLLPPVQGSAAEEQARRAQHAFASKRPVGYPRAVIMSHRVVICGQSHRAVVHARPPIVRRSMRSPPMRVTTHAQSSNRAIRLRAPLGGSRESEVPVHVSCVLHFRESPTVWWGSDWGPNLGPPHHPTLRPLGCPRPLSVAYRTLCDRSKFCEVQSNCPGQLPFGGVLDQL
jgi:hypothetical protein